MAEPGAPVPVSALILDARRKRGLLALWVALGLLAFANYAWTFRDLALGWISEGRVVFGLVVLAWTVFLVRDRWEQVARAPVRPSKWGLVFLAFSFVLLFVGTRAGLVFVRGRTSVFLRYLSLVALLCGVVILVFGWRAMWPLWMPALVLAFIFPENVLTTYWVPLRLQTVAAIASEKLIAALGIAVVRQGHVLETAALAANVEEACSGIRSLMTVVPAAIFISAYGLRRPGAKAALIVLSIPVTLLANVVRVVGTVLVGVYVSKEAAQGFFHYFAGLGIFAFSLVLLLILWQLLQGVERTGGRARDPTENDAWTSEARGRPRGRSVGTGLSRRAAVLGVLLVAGILYQGAELYHVHASRQRRPASPLASIPRRIGKWVAEDLPDPPNLDRQRHVSDALFRVYRAPGEPPIRVTLLYWRTGEGTFLGRRAHLPESCYPFHGMAQRWSKTTEVITGSRNLPDVVVRTTSFAAGEGAVIVTSWQQVGLRGEEIERRAYEGKLGQMLYGLREILRIGSNYPAELALQLSTHQSGPEERIMSAQTRFAPLLIREAADLVLADPAMNGAAPDVPEEAGVSGPR